MFIIIGVWGSRERKIRAAYQFFIYTLFGSIIMLLGILRATARVPRELSVGLQRNVVDFHDEMDLTDLVPHKRRTKHT